MTEIGRIIAHKTTHQDGGADEISLSGLSGQHLFIPYSAKIADINEDDTDQHTLDLQTALSETREIIAANLTAQRISGTGTLWLYSNEGTKALQTENEYYSHLVSIKDGLNRLLYKQGTANDDFDLFCLGYIVET